MNHERTNLRDRHYCDRHRLYGASLYQWDADMWEFDSALEPVALIETKHGNIKTLDISGYQFNALSKLANRAGVPFFCVVNFYLDAQGNCVNADEPADRIVHRQYLVIAVNDLAKEFLSMRGITSRKMQMTESQYVCFLYRLRKETPIRPSVALSETWQYVRVPSGQY